jgi:tyrosyl-tRNA synthetase
LKQIIARRDFQDRMDRGEPLRFHEALYSLMQGYDAYALKCDVQVGAYDQHFNMLAGRTIQEHFGDQPHVMITNPLIAGTDGRKMSKSYGNTINIRAEPDDIYGRTMRIADEYISEYLEYASSLTSGEIDELSQELDSGSNPMDIKKRLAFNLVEQYHGLTAARDAADRFKTVVQKKAVPDDVPEISVPTELLSGTWVDLCAGINLAKSKGELRRLMKQGGFYVQQEQIKDTGAEARVPATGILVRLGKRKYYRLVPKF